MEAAVAVAAGRYGVLSWPQARECGLNRYDLRRMVRRGEWPHPHLQVYVVRRLMPGADTPNGCAAWSWPPSSSWGRRRARSGRPRRGCGACGVWSGGTAAGSTWSSPALKRPRKLAGVALHGWNVRPEEVAVLGDGLRVTDPGRTLRDTVPSLDRESAVCLMDSALNQGLLKERDIESMNRVMRGARGAWTCAGGGGWPMGGRRVRWRRGSG